MQKDYWAGYFIVRNTLFVYNTEVVKIIANKCNEKNTNGPYVMKKSIISRCMQIVKCIWRLLYAVFSILTRDAAVEIGDRAEQ